MKKRNTVKTASPSEAAIFKKVQMAFCKLGGRLLRNHVAFGYSSNRVTKFSRSGVVTITVNEGDVLLRDARPFKAGLGVGSGDGVGYYPMVITPAMVGRTVAVFTSGETKKGDAKPTEEQLNWDEQIRKNGGFSFITNDEKKVEKLLDEYINPV